MILPRSTKTPSPTVSVDAPAGRTPSPPRAPSSERAVSGQPETSLKEQPLKLMEVISVSAESLEARRNQPGRGDLEKVAQKSLDAYLDPALQLNDLKAEWKGMLVGASSFTEKFDVSYIFYSSFYSAIFPVFMFPLTNIPCIFALSLFAQASKPR